MVDRTAHIELTLNPDETGDLRYTAYLVENDQYGIGATPSEALADLASWIEN